MSSILDRIDDICDTFTGIERKPKLNSMDEILSYFGEEKQNEEEILKIFDASYLHLLKLYEDRYENVREKAVDVVTEFIIFLEPNDFHAMNIISSIRTRLGQFETIEESEEIRLSLMLQFNKLLQRYCDFNRSDFLVEFLEDSQHILDKCLRDKYPKVQYEACATCILFGKIFKDMEFRQVSEKLCKPLFNLLAHKHALIRAAAVEALGYLALHVDPSNEKLKLILMSISPVLMDSVTTVRRQCGETGAMLLVKLPDRYSFFELILPLVLCCLKDESNEVVDYVEPLWIKSGKNYYDENEAELSNQELGDIPAKNYPKYLKRPTIGCRGLVQRCLRLVHLILRESSDWKENVRLHSFKLFYQFILHAEDALTAKFFEFYRDLARGCFDNDHDVAAEAIKCAKLLGCLLRYQDWFQHGYDGLQKNAKEGYLRCFYYMFKNANDVPFCDLVKVANLLVHPEFSHSLKLPIQKVLLKLLQVLFDKSNIYMQENDAVVDLDELNKLDQAIYVVTVKILALTTDLVVGIPPEIQSLGESLLHSISKRQKISIGLIHEEYFLFALDDCSKLDMVFDHTSEPIMLLTGLIYIAKFRACYMTQLQQMILSVFEHSTNCAKIKMMTVLAIVMLDWNNTINAEFSQNCALLEEFLLTIIDPYLNWKAGGAAETLRALATNTLCSVTQCAYKESENILPKYAKVLVVLLEDYSVTTRQNALKTLVNFCELDIEDLKPLAYGVLQRMDDPSSAMRKLACIVLTKLRLKKGSEKNQLDMWHTFVTKAIEMLILHYEGPDLKYRESCKNALIYFAENYAEQTRDCMKRSESIVHESESLNLLQKYLVGNEA